MTATPEHRSSDASNTNHNIDKTCHYAAKANTVVGAARVPAAALGVAIASSLLLSDAAWAQQSAGALEEIVVTARKREESLLEIPLAVQAFSAAELSAAGIDDLEDLTRFAPGLDYKNQSGTQQVGRYLPSIRFRGLTPQTSLPSNQVGSLFVDGVFVLGGAQSIGLEDVERAEVIRGPQSAYFGRSTFGGAINYVTRAPASEFGGTLTGQFSPDYDSHRFSASIEGPIAGDTLSGRLTASSLKRGAYVTATDGGALGEEKTQALHAALQFTPSDRLQFKMRASFIEDEDTQPAATQIQFFNTSNCAAGTPLTVLDASGTRRDVTLQGPYWCGALPDSGIRVSANTQFTTIPGTDSLPEVDLFGVFVENTLGIPELDDAPSLSHFGLKRELFRFAVSGDYELSDSLTLSGNIAYNEQDLIQIADRDYTDAQSVYMGPPSFFEDRSGELRLQFDAGGRVRAMAGINYFKQDIRASFLNGVEVTNELSLDIFPQPFSLRVLGSQNSGNNDDEIETLGIFGSFEYDLTSELTLTLEARWQDDEVTTFGGQFLNPSDPLTLESSEFLPRAIATWKPTDELTAYVSYAEGTLPGQFNRNVLTLSPEELAAVLQIVPGLGESVESEQLTSFEVGLKQSALGGRLNYAAAAYFLEWENMKSSVSYLIPGRTGLQSSFISGASEVKGLEFQGSFLATEKLTLAASLEFVDSEYTDFVVGGTNVLFGLSALEGYRVDGNTLPRYPEVSGSLSGTYRDSFNGDWDWYGRGDLTYTGKAYTDETNLNWVDPYTVIGLRLGVEKQNLQLEFYVDNLLDEDGWITGATGLDLGVVPILFSNLFTRRGAVVTQMRPREAGIRAVWSF